MSDAHLRLSDDERERAVAELNEHYAQGRLDATEHGQRLDRVWAARTRGELGPLFRDLPGQGYGRGPALPWPPYGAAPVARPVRAVAPRHGLPTPVLVGLVVLTVVVVAAKPGLLFLALILWFLVRPRGRRHAGWQRRY